MFSDSDVHVATVRFLQSETVSHISRKVVSLWLAFKLQFRRTWMNAASIDIWFWRFRGFLSKYRIRKKCHAIYTSKNFQDFAVILTSPRPQNRRRLLYPETQTMCPFRRDSKYYWKRKCYIWRRRWGIGGLQKTALFPPDITDAQFAHRYGFLNKSFFQAFFSVFPITWKLSIHELRTIRARLLLTR